VIISKVVSPREGDEGDYQNEEHNEDDEGKGEEKGHEA